MQKKIIIFIVIIFVLSSAYLLFVGSKFGTLDFGKNWWAVYFENPKSDDLNFVIENHSANFNFHWKVLADKEKISEGDISLLELSSRITPEINIKELENKKITIEVSSGDEKKEIYKNF